MSDEGQRSDTVTDGIRVRVTSSFVPAQSIVDGPALERRFAFSYTVTVTNEGRAAVTLLARHWVITDATGREEHVRGPGVVGFQPSLGEAQSFTYSSAAVLRAPPGTMHGEYLMERDDGSRFDATIAPFALVQPDAVQ